jgi:hypothetical protein
MVDHSYFIELTSADRIRVRFSLDRGVVVDFVVQYEALIEERWQPIVRYDLAHGYLHCDRPDPRGIMTTKEAILYGTLAAAMTEAIREIKIDWSEYRRWFEERLL